MYNKEHLKSRIGRMRQGKLLIAQVPSSKVNSGLVQGGMKQGTKLARVS